MSWNSPSKRPPPGNNLTAKIKKMLSMARNLPAPSLREPKSDPDFEGIVELVASMRVLQQQAVASYAPVVHDLIERQCRDEEDIERTLDHLLDCACIPEGLQLFKALCRYYGHINPQATTEYVSAYREIWDSDSDQEQEVVA